MRLIKYTKCIVNQRDKIPYRAFFFAFALLTLCFFRPQSAQAQVVNPSISFSVGSCTLDVALEKLFADYEVKVAFSKAELSLVEIPAYSCSYKPLDDVLHDLLRDTGFGYKKIGRQYVIKKIPAFEPIRPSDQTDPAVPPQVENHKIDTVLNRRADTLRIYDTLFVTRILLRRDTVTQIKTVGEHDTTYIRKRNPLAFNWPSFRSNGWFLNLSYLHEWGRFSKSLAMSDYAELYERHLASGNDRNAVDGIAAEVGRKSHRLSYGISLSYRALRYDFAFDKTVLEGDYYVNDTLDSYYVVNPFIGDTSYYYILDSLYVPLVTNHYAVRDVNRLDYLGVGAFFSFDFLSFEYFRMFVKAGISVDFLLNASGTTFALEAPFQTAILREQAAPVKCNYYGGLGAALKVGQRLELVPEVRYHGCMGSLYRDNYPIRLQTHSVELKLGLTYYF